MTIWIIYTLKTLLLPQSSLLLLTAGGVVALQRRHKTGLIIVNATLATWFLLSTPLIARALNKSLETYPVLQETQINTFRPQAIVILGGGLNLFAPEYSTGISINAVTLERLRYGAKLARKTHLPILVSGGKVFDPNLPAEAEMMAEALLEDYDLQARWQERESHNTTENAANSSALLGKEKIDRIILVTHALHMPRAAEAFSQRGVNLLAAPTGYLADNTDYDILSFLPSAKAFFLSSAALHEYLGRIWYTLNTS